MNSNRERISGGPLFNEGLASLKYLFFFPESNKFSPAHCTTDNINIYYDFLKFLSLMTPNHYALYIILVRTFQIKFKAKRVEYRLHTSRAVCPNQASSIEINGNTNG